MGWGQSTNQKYLDNSSPQGIKWHLWRGLTNCLSVVCVIRWSDVKASESTSSVHSNKMSFLHTHGTTPNHSSTVHISCKLTTVWNWQVQDTRQWRLIRYSVHSFSVTALFRVSVDSQSIQATLGVRQEYKCTQHFSDICKKKKKLENHL